MKRWSLPFVVLTACALAACSPQAQQQTQSSVQQGVNDAKRQLGPQLHQAGVKLGDGALEVRVSAAIAAEAGANAFHITPVARHGVVTLTGRVPNATIARTVVTTARAVPGVTRIVDHLTVR
jgi:osmotically-inducible protein OsmY